MSNAPPISRAPRGWLHDALADRARRLARQEAIAGALWLVATLALMLLILVIADHDASNGLPLGTRRLALAIAAAVVLALSAVTLRRWRRQVSPAYVAAELEAGLGLSHNPLRSWESLSREVPDDVAVALSERAEAALSAAPAPRPKAPATTRVAGLALAGIAFAWLVYAALAPKPVAPALIRALGLEHPAATASRIECVRPADGSPVYLGKELPLEFQLSGAPAREMTLTLMRDGGPPISFRLTSSDGKRFTSSLMASEITPAFTLIARANDAELRRDITAIAKPGLVEMQTLVTPPAYTHQPPRAWNQGRVEALEGSTLEITCLANGELQAPVYVFRGAVELRTRMERIDARRAGVTRVARESGVHWIEFRDANAVSNTPRPEPVIVRPDEPPTIEITVPSAEGEGAIDVRQTPWLRAMIRDDVGLGSAEVAIERGAAIEHKPLLSAAPEQAPREAPVAFSLPDLGLAVGETARLWLEAGDGRVLANGEPAPQTTRSQVLTITCSAAPPDVSAEEAAPERPSPWTPGEGAKQTQRVREGERRQTAPGAGGAGGEGGKPTRADGRTPPEPDPEMNEIVGRAGESAAEAEDGGDESDADAATRRGEAEREFTERLKRFAAERQAELREIQEKMDAQAAGGGGGRQTSQGGGATGSAPSRPGGADEPSSASQPVAESEPDASDPNRPSDSQPAAEPMGEAAAEESSEPPASQPRAANSGDAPPSHSDGVRPPKEGPAEPAERDDQPAPDRPRDQAAAPGEKSTDATAQDGASGAPSPESAKDEPADSQPSAGRGDDTPSHERTGPVESDDATLDVPLEEPEPAAAEIPSAADRTALEAAIGARAEWMDTLEMIRRTEPVSDEFLAELGWTPERRGNFLAELQRLRELARQVGLAGPDGVWQGPAMAPGSATGGGASRVPVSSQAELDAFLEGLSNPPEQKTAPELQKLLEAYYRSLRPARGAPSPDP